jgi:hypothetical protein
VAGREKIRREGETSIVLISRAVLRLRPAKAGL